jgi:quinohemoprotein amine dehydrogenase
MRDDSSSRPPDSEKDNMRCGRSIHTHRLARAAVILLTLAMPPFVRGQTEPGIPVTDPLVLARCGTCHTVDERGNMERISWARATPEGWQAAAKRMIAENGVSVTPLEARGIVKYLSTRNGLAPEEAKPVMYAAERRIHDESDTGSDSLQDACARCHQAARALSWRRTADDWKRFAARHGERYQFTPDREAIVFLIKAAPLHTREWDAWSARTRTAELGGRWLVTAHLPGRGNFYGEMDVEATGGDDQFLTRTRLRSIDGTSALARTGRALAYGGTAWRGRSSGSSLASAAPEDPANAAQEAMLIAPDGASVAGRWFWGQYEELGFDVKMQRPSSDPILLLVEPQSFKAGSNSNQIRLIGDRFPAQVTTADVFAGPAVTVRRIVSSTSSEIVAELDVARDASLGRRNIAFRSSTLERAVAIYDRVDYVKVTPDSSLAAFSNDTYLRGYQQFEAIGYQRGPDGRRHTADDLELGPVDVAWSMEVFYEVDQSKRDRVGTLSPAGLFAPAAVNPGVNDDVWIIATTKNEKSSDGKPLVGKSYLVVTVPTYTFNGRTYVRDLDRWIEERSSGR